MWTSVCGVLFLLSASGSSKVFLQRGSSFKYSCEDQNPKECAWNLNNQKPCTLENHELKNKCFRGVHIKKNGSSCDLIITHFDPIAHTGIWRCSNQGEIYVTEIIGPNVTLFGSVDVYKNDVREFSCIVAGGAPKPSKLQWITSSSRGGAETLLKEIELSQNVSSTQIQLHGKESLDGQNLICRALQIDHGGALIPYDDTKVIKVEKSLSQSRSTDFQIKSRYPSGLRGRTVTLILAKDKMSTFTCSTSSPWHVCQWKSPISKEPCGIFNGDDPRDCRRLWNIKESQDLNASHNTWVVSKRNTQINSCSISGLVTTEHEGTWNCEMQSKPYGQNDQYFHDQQYFEIKTVKVPTINVNNLPQEMQMSENEVTDIKVDVSDAFPEPILRWFLNSDPYEPERISFQHRDNSIVAEYQYIADPKHSGKRLSLEVVQVDDEGKEVATRYESFLSIQQALAGGATAMGEGVIAAIVIGVITALLLCCVLLLLLITKRRGKDRLLVVKKESPESGVMSTQTMGRGTESIGTGMEELEKLGRRGSRERLLKEPAYSELTFDPDSSRKLSALLSPDEIEVYNYEGSGSTAGSLSSLDSIEDMDHYSIFCQPNIRSNPKFRNLIESFPLSDEEESDSISISYDDSEV